MKPKEYVKKFKLDQEKVWFSHEEFIQDFTFDFMAQIQYHQTTKNWSYNVFQNIVTQTKDKFDQIGYKMPNQGLPESLWKYFYATVVAPTREKQFGEFVRQQKRQKAKEWARRNQWRTWQDEFWNRFWTLDIFKTIQCPTSEFQFLGLDPSSATEDEVKTIYRKMSFKCHPDHGGKQEDFINLTTAKDKCLLYISRRAA